MATKITRQILEAYLSCKKKAHLKLAGQQGIVSDYEALLISTKQEVRKQAIEKILARKPGAEVARDVPLTAATLRAGSTFLLNATLEDDLLSLSFDGLKRIDGPSKLGNFHYVPMLFHERRKVGKEQKRLLEIYGLLLSRLQGHTPSFGNTLHGTECRTTRVRLNGDLRKTERLLRDVKEMVESPPKLILNDHCHVCEFRQQCHEQAVQEDHISLLRGMGEKEIKKYARKGIFTVTQLAHTFRPRRRGKRSPPKSNRRYHALHALAVRDKRVYVLGMPQIPETPVHIYMDVEGDPERGFDYLVGIIVVQGVNEQRSSFWADNRDEEDRMFEQFIDKVNQYQDFRVFAYGGYERAFLMRMRQRAKQQAPLDRVLKSLVNVLSLVYSHVYFPTYSNGLKDVAACLGFSWTDQNASGVQSLVWRLRWEATHAEEWKQKLITYNQEDCLALRRTTEFISTHCARPEPELGTFARATSDPIVASLDEIDRLGTVNTRGRKPFFHADFAHINRCARFDYQRQRVYIRLGQHRLKKHEVQPRKFRNRKLRVNQRVEITSQKCPTCGGNEINRPSKAHFGKGCFTKGKRAFDLVFTSSGIKRKVIECRASIHHCLNCGRKFVPERYERLAKHFHGLMSWAMYEHIVHRLSAHAVSDMMIDLFGLTVYPAEVTRFRPMMARYYESSYDALLATILSSHVIQIDETEVRLRATKGYVWVITTSEDVVYVYRPTREGDFLHDLLKDFHGVLVTDFYAAYDSIDCPQQKCLLHLMRDMNQELLDNPFDEELQSITGAFGALLRGIVVTIDEHGLKRQHLLKHAREIDEFVTSLDKQSFRSESAESLRERLIKNRDKLFTFIHHDGVPWNNNTPENAIRQFAYYRDSNPGRLKEPGLKEYLVLLSLCQTCRYKKVSFLRFLLSRERDISAFCKRPRSKYRCVDIEIYPKGVVRPDFGGRVKRTGKAATANGESEGQDEDLRKLEGKP
jgi:predicted RecB family nuclease